MKEYVYHGSHTPHMSTLMHSDYYYYSEGDGLTSDVILVERKSGMFKKNLTFRVIYIN